MASTDIIKSSDRNSKQLCENCILIDGNYFIGIKYICDYCPLNYMLSYCERCKFITHQQLINFKNSKKGFNLRCLVCNKLRERIFKKNGKHPDTCYLCHKESKDDNICTICTNELTKFIQKHPDPDVPTYYPIKMKIPIYTELVDLCKGSEHAEDKPYFKYPEDKLCDVCTKAKSTTPSKESNKAKSTASPKEECTIL